MLAKNSNYIEAYDYEFTKKTHDKIQETDYIRLLLQAPFNAKKRNLLIFINQEPISYSCETLEALIDYLFEEDRITWQNCIEEAFTAGNAINKRISNLWVSGQSMGKAYIVTTEYREDTKDDIDFLQKSLKSISDRAKKYKEYCDLIQDPFWVRDKNLNLLYVNKAFLEITESCDIENIRKNNLWLCNAAKSNILAQLALQKNDTQTMDIPYIKQGKTLFGLVSEMPIIDDEGAVFLFGRLQDKTAEKALKQRVTNLEAGLKEILTNISIAASFFDNHRRLRFYNQAFIDLWGFTPDYLDTAPDHLDILDKLHAKRLIPESRDFKNWKNELFEPYHDLKAYYEDIWHTPQQKTIKCTISAYADGGVVCLQEDVTDHIALEQSHTILSQNLRNTLDALDEGIILCDSNGKMKVINQKITDIFQIDIELNSHLVALHDDLVEESDLRNFIQKIYSFIQNGFPDNEKYIQECNINDTMLIASVARLSTSDILIHIRDQTALLNYQKILHYQAETLEENEHIRDSFFRRISHNLRDPMTSVAGFAELLQTEIFGTLNDKQREYIADMRYSIDDLLRLTDNLADLVRLDTQTLNDFEKISLQETVISAIEAMQNEAFSRKITLKRDLDEDFTIYGDQTLLRQSFIQLLENAIMVTPRGGEITIAMRQDNTHIIAEIIDQGVGMTDSLIDAITAQKITDIKGYGLRYVLRVAGLHNGLCYANLIKEADQAPSGTCIQMCFKLNKTHDL
ncbi:MAG: signal transduction histidine kinase [Alphaproteobacteria bacterium]|jgi:signal transduction histidine kinase